MDEGWINHSNRGVRIEIKVIAPLHKEAAIIGIGFQVELLPQGGCPVLGPKRPIAFPDEVAPWVS